MKIGKWKHIFWKMEEWKFEKSKNWTFWKTVWYPMVPYGTIGYHMVPYSTIWYHTVPYGTLWYYMVPYGSIVGLCRLLSPVVPSLPCCCFLLVPYGPLVSF